MRPRPSHQLASILVATVAAAAPALAAWPHDPHNGNVPLSSFASSQAFPRMAPDGAGGAFIAWEDSRTSFDVYAQRVSASGATMWGAAGVAVCGDPQDQFDVVLAADGAGGVIIAWIDTRGTTSDDVYAQRLNAAGVPQWTANGVAICTAPGDQSDPQIVPDGAGGAILTWTDRRGANADIYAQRVNGAGATTWLANGQNICNAGFDQVTPVIVSDAAGGAIIAWSDFRSGIVDIYAQRLQSSGAPLWAGNGIGVCTAVNGQYEPCIVADGSGGAIIAWTDGRAGNTDIWSQRVSADGSFLWPANGALVSGTPASKFLSQITSDGAGGAIVTWQAVGALEFTDVFAQRMSAGGIGLWLPEGRAVCLASGDQVETCIVSDGAGGAIIAWTDQRTAFFDILAQRIDANGDVRWSGNGAPVSAANKAQYAPAIVSDGAGGAILAWTDDRNGITPRTYAQRIERYGQLGNPEATITSVRDTPNDQGGKVKVSWSASYLDVDPTYGITEYRLWRSAPVSAASALTLEGDRTTHDADEAAATGKWLVLPDAATAYAWELVAGQPAATLPSYSLITATLSDSVTGSNPRTAFMVEARATAEGTTPRWFSAPDSGYSVDNLAPAMPAPFSAITSDGAHHLDWGANAEADLAGYRIYRGVTPGFVPSAVTLLAEQAGTGFVDPTSYAYFYKLSAIDVHGNESAYASLATAGTTDVEDGDRPATLRLAVPEPNPARARTRVQFDLTQRAFVSLMVFDAGGRAVRVLTRGVREAGRFGTTWDLCDDAGREVPSGLYFVRLETAGRTLVRRIVAMR